MLSLGSTPLKSDVPKTCAENAIIYIHMWFVWILIYGPLSKEVMTWWHKWNKISIKAGISGWDLNPSTSVVKIGSLPQIAGHFKSTECMFPQQNNFK